MASKRGIRRRELKSKCLGKKQYSTLNDAKKVCYAIHKRENLMLMTITPYKCKFCNLWHVGHSPHSVIYGYVKSMIK